MSTTTSMKCETLKKQVKIPYTMLKYVFPMVVKYWEYSDDQGRHATRLYRIYSQISQINQNSQIKKNTVC